MEARSLRVLMIAPTSFFADYGCHVRILEEAQILQKLGQRVTILTYHNGKPVPGLDIRRTMPIPWRRQYEVGSSRHKIAFDALLGAKTLEMLLRGKFDVIHAHLHEGALIGLVFGRLFRVPVVFDFQGSMTEEMVDHRFLSRESRLYAWLRRLETWIDSSSPAVFTSSEHAACLLLERSHCDPARVCALPDCVNTNAFRPASTYRPGELAALRTSLGIPPDRKLIVYLGLLAEYQGTDLLLQAMQRIVTRHDDAHLLLMGFPAVAQYTQQARDLGIASHVTLTGGVPYQQAPIHLALGDVAVAPKLSLTEGAGKILNYMAVGMPVVAFDTPVAREYLGRDGMLAVARDVGSLADSLEQCLFPSPALFEYVTTMGERLRQRAEQHFNWENGALQILDTYDRLLGLLPRTVLTTQSLAITPKQGSVRL